MFCIRWVVLIISPAALCAVCLCALRHFHRLCSCFCFFVFHFKKLHRMIQSFVMYNCVLWRTPQSKCTLWLPTFCPSIFTPILVRIFIFLMYFLLSYWGLSGFKWAVESFSITGWSISLPVFVSVESCVTSRTQRKTGNRKRQHRGQWPHHCAFAFSLSDVIALMGDY